MSNEYPAVGAFYDGRNCLFSVWAPHSEKVEVVIGEGLYSMRKSGLDHWTVVIEDVDAGTPYWFRINGKNLPDPASRWQAEGVHGPSFVVDTRFTWTDESWRGIPLSEMIIYELHVGTFSDEGNFEGVISRLDYLKSLGITVIELMPVAQFPGSRNWGYDGVYPYATHHDYGGAIGLMKLVDEAHRRGIAVILDVVYNHQGPEGNYFSEFGPYFTDKYKTFWGRAINFDDAWCDGVRNFYWQNAIMWLDEFHIDGLRLDAVHAIWDFSALHFIEELARRVKGLENECNKKKILIAEFDLNNPRYIRTPEKGGFGLDGQWIDEFHHALHSVVTGEVNGYYEDFGELAHLAKAFQDSYVYTGQYSRHRKKHFGVDPLENSYEQFVVFAQNHDQIGNRMLGDRLTASQSFEGLKLIAATVLLAPQVPLLFMGEEYGEKNPFQYFISHTDPAIVKMVQEGRKQEFSYFHMEGEFQDPQDEKTFEQCKLSWSHTQGEHAVLLAYYQYLISFRKDRVAMQGRGRQDVRVYEEPGKKILVLQRSFGEDRLLILFNFEKNKAEWSHPLLGSATKIFDSSAHRWTVKGYQDESVRMSADRIVMNAESALIFELSHP
ncbi:MAG TPA: malto-oligosyltrehalose trehalohydrolase [Chryseolinea sp.]